jgi:hypothetical protein
MIIDPSKSKYKILLNNGYREQIQNYLEQSTTIVALYPGKIQTLT